MLSFRAPVSLSEPLPQLESDGASNDDFMLHRKWLVSTLDVLDGIKDFGNKEIAGQHAGLAKQIEREINSMLAFEENQWRLAKVRANLYGSPTGNGEREPPIIRAGASSCMFVPGSANHCGIRPILRPPKAPKRAISRGSLVFCRSPPSFGWRVPAPGKLYVT
jgi:hypothetical protein